MIYKAKKKEESQNLHQVLMKSGLPQMIPMFSLGHLLTLKITILEMLLNTTLLKASVHLRLKLLRTKE